MDSQVAGSAGQRRKPVNIVIVGGTHGNEKGGIWTVQHLLAKPLDYPAPGLSVRAVLANPQAMERNLRYLDRDLNRCFGPELAHARPDHPLLERRRALELREAICPKGAAPDLVVDLHNTTANMGLCWILPSLSPWPLYLAWQASLRDDRVRILHTPETAQSNVFLPSLGREEITLEIGPVSHGTHCQWAFEAAQGQVRDLLGILAKLPQDFDPRQALASARFEFFETVSVERYPTTPSDQIRCILHGDRVGRDFLPLSQGQPLYFDPLEGTTIPYHGPTIHPVFVGEAAYVESGISFHATRRLQWNGTQGAPC